MSVEPRGGSPYARTVAAPPSRLYSRVPVQREQPGQSPQGPAGKSSGLLKPGNIDLNNRPVVHNPDGSYSTVRSITVTDDRGQAILIPTVVGNKVVPNQQAISHFRRTGQHLGVFDSEADANAYAQTLHQEQAAQYGRRAAKVNPNDVDPVTGKPPAKALGTTARSALDYMMRGQLATDAYFRAHGHTGGLDPVHVAAVALHALIHGTQTPEQTRAYAQTYGPVHGAPVFNPITAGVDAILHAPAQLGAARDTAAKIAHPSAGNPPSLKQNVEGLLSGSFGVPLARLKKDETPALRGPRVPKGKATPQELAGQPAPYVSAKGLHEGIGGFIDTATQGARPYEYLYHRTTPQAFTGIRAHGLTPTQPAGNPAGVYFGNNPLQASGLAQKYRDSVVVRVRREAVPNLEERAFGESLTSGRVPAQALEYLAEDGKWHPVVPLGQQVREGLRGAGAVRTAQEKGYSVERSQRIAEAERIMNDVGGEEGHRLALKALSGDLPKLEFNGFNDLSRDNVPALFQHIQEHPVLRPFEKVRARTALLNVFDGKVPTRSELRLMEVAFGKEDASKLAGSTGFWKQAGNFGLQLLNVPRALKSSFDLSAPFRQGLVLGARHPQMFASEFRPMLKSFRSENAYMDVMDEIASRPTFPAMQNAKLALTDLEHISNREEAFASNLAEYVPGVRASGRAYVAFLNKFRADAFDTYIRLAESQGRDPTDPALVQSIARWVNNATGRGGSSKFIASHAVGLNATFFSPRLIASRLNLLINPQFYAKLDPFARKQALRGMAQLIGAISLTLWLAKLNGAKVGTDPRSADFGKIKVGNTRVDVMGGFQQYIVAADRLVKGETVSSTTGAVEHLTGGFGKSSRGTLLTRLAQQKFAPVPAYAWGFLNNENFSGKPFDPLKEAGLLVAPLGPQNAVDTYRQEGVGPALAGLGLGSVGFGVQTYGPKPRKGSSGDYGSGGGSGGSDYGSSDTGGGSPYGGR